MNIEGLAVDIEGCPDGVELVDMTMTGGVYGPGNWSVDRYSVGAAYGPIEDFDWPEKRAFRYRTARREPRAWTIDNLENPIVIAFVNATDDEQRLLFFGRYGLGARGDPLVWNLMYGGTRRSNVGPARGIYEYSGRGALHYDAVLKQQSYFRELLQSASGPDHATAMEAINSTLSSEIALHPTFHLAGPRGTPQLLLKCAFLHHFMLMEVAMIVANGVRVAECEQCHTLFCTGPLTWRRSHARFCSDRCRVAAMRARQAANMDSNEGGTHVSS
jgi:hypothetical protein